jgi:hypothetical protein
VDTKGIRTFIDEDNIPIAWGGRNSYEFAFVPEIRESCVTEKENEMTSLHNTSNNNSEKQDNLNNGVPKKVSDKYNKWIYQIRQKLGV